VEAIVGQGPGAPGMGFGLPMTKPATLVLGLAGREAMELDHDRVGTQELLLALAREGEGVAARVLQELGAGLLELRFGPPGTVRGEAPPLIVSAVDLR
jgi:ATP-dependent Clp protease ATP-binding subunit ClpC